MTIKQIIITVMVSITAFSYAFLTRIDEQHGKLNIVVTTLDYKIESDDLNNNSITLGANESKEYAPIFNVESPHPQLILNLFSVV